MKISIITVSYNSAKTIEDTIRSVISQSYKNIEYIVIDGNSVDGTKEIITKYSNKIAYFVSEKDNGIYDAMNKGLAAATGDVIGILNSDDVYKNADVISHIVQFFEKENVEAIGTHVAIFKEELTKIIRFYSCTKWKKWMFRIGWQPPHPGIFIKKDCYTKYGNFDTQFRIAADFDLLLRFIHKNKINIAFKDFTSVLMRAGGESQSSFRNVAKTNKEDYLSLKKNGYFVWPIFIWFKYLFKIFQFWSKI